MSQLERLARPFPPKYVKAPAKGKYGSYVPHDVVQQALLAILGPVDIHIGEVFKGESGKIEGCLVTLDVQIDGRFVGVTEVGDCERPDNWQTQGARMKDAISDGIKRCAMRLGLGLHLWAQEDYFLYDQLRQENAEGAKSQDKSEPGVLITHPVAAPSATPAGPSEESAPNDGPAVSKARRERLKSRCVALTADGVSVADEREKLKLPLVDSCNEVQIAVFEQMVDALEHELQKPFVEAPA